MNQIFSSAQFSRLLANIGKYGLKSHSGQVEPGDIFVVLPLASPSENVHNNPHSAKFMADAIERGASIVLAQLEQIEAFQQSHPALAAKVDFYQVDDSRASLAKLAVAKFNTNQLPFPLIGITGTNGKTTITYLFEHLYKSCAKNTGVFGTVTYRWPGHEQAAPLTTPDCLTVHSMLANMRDSGPIAAAFLEVSSHALIQKRVLELEFAGAIFTNLTQDHLDFHADMEDYFQAKTKLFFSPYAAKNQIAVINSDDPYGRRLVEILMASGQDKSSSLGKVITFGLAGNPAPKTSKDTGINKDVANKHRHLQGEILSSGRNGLQLRMSFEGCAWEISSPLVGNYNALNLLSVQALALNFGFEPDDFKCFENFSGTPGRLERVLNPQNLHVFVDYAHSPDALVNVQRELKKAGFKRLITVFGCGGNRDRGKRPLMGEAVAKYADIAVLTSDNPRNEDPLAIMDDVRPGLASCPQVIEEVNRRKAIAMAIELTGPEDALLVAGKGHEDYQIIGDIKYPFSDQKIIEEILLCK